MACVKAPTIPPLPFPVGFSVTLPALPPLPDADLTLCCHINLPLSMISQVLSLGSLSIFAADILAPINALILEVDAVLDQLQVGCPLE